MTKKGKKEKVSKKDFTAPRGKGQKPIAAPKEPGLADKFPWLQPPNDQWLGWLCFAGIIVLSFLMSFHTLTDTDIFWHLKTGQIIFETHRIPHQDIYSFTMAGKEWIDAQWLFQLMLYLTYRIGGFAGLIFFGSILTALTWILILLPGYDPKRYFRLILLVLISLFASSLRLKLRPELFSFFFLVLELVLLNSYRGGKRRALYPIPFLIWLWVNSQGLWPLGIFLLMVMLGEQVLALPQIGLQKYFNPALAPAGKRTILELGICLAVSSLLIWINPYGWKGIVFPLKLIWEISSSESFIGNYIAEFMSPFSMDKTLVAPYFVLIVFSGLLFTFLIFSRRLPPADLMILGAFFYLSATARRNVSLFTISTAIIGARQILNLSAPVRPRFKFFSARLLRFRPLAGGILVIGMLWWGGEIITSRFFIWNGLGCRFGIGALETEYPIRASQFLKSISGLKSAQPLKIFTDLFNSGYLIWAGYPDWKVYVDPRMEQVYSDQFVKRYASLYNNWQDFKQEDLKYHFDLVVVTSYQPGALGFLHNFYYNPEWVLIYFDGNSVVFLKNQPSFSQVIQDYQMDLSEKLNTPLPKNLGGIWMANERNYRGAFLLALKHRELALDEFEDGLKYNPKDPNLIYNLGLTLNRLNRYPEALPYLEKYAKINPGSIPNQIQLGWALASTGKPDRAIRILQGILNTSPNEVSACVKLARVFEMVKDKDRAYAQWRRCWEVFRQDPIKFKSEALEISEALKRYPGIDAPLLSK